jgi:hypothetical protein
MNAIFHIFLSKSKNTFTKPDESIYDGALKTAQFYTFSHDLYSRAL